MDKILLVIMVAFSLFCTGGCYKSVCADPVCREVQPVDGSPLPEEDAGLIIDAGSEQPDGALADGGELPEEDAGFVAIDPDCPPPPAGAIPQQWFAAFGASPPRENARAVAMAGTCQPTVFALSDLDETMNEGVIQSVTFVSTGSSSTVTGDEFLTSNGLALTPATYGLASYTKGETSRHTYLTQFNSLGESEIGTVILIPNDRFKPLMAETPTDPVWLYLEHQEAGDNVLHSRRTDVSGLSPILVNYAFSMPTRFMAGEAIGFNQGFAIKLARIENNSVIGEILFLRSSGAQRVTFAQRRLLSEEDPQQAIRTLLYLYSDFAPHPDGVLVAANDAMGASAYLLHPDGSKYHVIPMNGTASAVALLPYGFAAASYQGGQIHLVIRETLSGINHWHNEIAPYPVTDPPRITSAYYGYRLGVTVSYDDLRTNTPMMQVRNLAHLP